MIHENEKKLILPNSGKFYTLNELENIQYIKEKKQKEERQKIFKKYVTFNLSINEYYIQGTCKESFSDKILN